MSRFLEYENHHDKYESLFTCIFHDIKADEVVKKLDHHLKKVQAINNSYRRKYINDRLYNFITELKTIDGNTQINAVYLVGKDVNKSKLRKKELKILREYDIDKYIFRFANIFDIEYLVSLFTDLEFNDAIQLKNNTLKWYKVNSTKRKKVDEYEKKSLDVEEYVKSNDINKCVIFGSSSSLKKIKNKSLNVINKNLSWEEVMDEFTRMKIQENHKLLSSAFDMLDNEKTSSKIIYGKLEKEIKEAIEMYRVKELYIDSKSLKTLKSKIDKDYFNFKIILIESFKKGDVGDKLIKDYNGVLGVAYY